LWVFIKHKVMSYVFNFFVEILLTLTYGLRSADHTMNDSPFYVIYVGGFEVQITTSIVMFPVPFRDQ
jgi:hypothetical protein